MECEEVDQARDRKDLLKNFTKFHVCDLSFERRFLGYKALTDSGVGQMRKAAI